jgi:putative SOS response-associated peptidase YedK
MDVYTIFTTTPNAVVKPIHTNRMPVMLGSIDEFDTWLEGTPDEAWQLARPYPVSESPPSPRGQKRTTTRGGRSHFFAVAFCLG